MDDTDTNGYELVKQCIIKYSDLGTSRRLFGGQLLSWIDEGVAMFAMKKMDTQQIVTRKISELLFEAPGQLGDLVEFWCKVSHEGSTSLTIECKAIVLRKELSEKDLICECQLIYVALDSKGKPTQWH